MPVYGENENVKLKIDYSAKKNYDNLAFRIVIQTLDKIRVGMATSQPCVHALEGNNTISIELQTAWLAPGKYSCSIVVYSVNEFGTAQVHDRIQNICVFEIVRVGECNNNMTWNPNDWGHIMMPQIKVITEESVQK